MQLIDRGLLICDYLQRIGAKDTYKAKYEALEAAVDNAPTIDAVPVVRCKDCKHLCMPLIMCDIGGIYAPIPYNLEKHFCAQGEPRT